MADLDLNLDELEQLYSAALLTMPEEFNGADPLACRYSYPQSWGIVDRYFKRMAAAMLGVANAALLARVRELEKVNARHIRAMLNDYRCFHCPIRRAFEALEAANQPKEGQ